MGDIKDIIDLMVGLANKSKDRQTTSEMLEIQSVISKFYIEQTSLHSSLLEKQLALLTENASLKDRIAALQKREADLQDRVAELEAQCGHEEELQAQIKKFRDFIGPIR